MRLPNFVLGVSGLRAARIIPLTMLLIVFLLLASTASAHGVADQVNDPETLISRDCGLDLPGGFPPTMFQSFTPSADNLVAVDLRLRVTGTIPVGGVSNTIWVREGDPGGPILGTSTATVTGTGTYLVHYDFTPAIDLTPGDTYVIERSSHVTMDWQLSWMSLDGDPYPGGTAFGCFGTPIAGWDQNFITYEEAHPPVANDDSASATHNTPTVIDVAANDYDEDADLVLSSVAIISGPANGGAVANGDGTVTYTSNPGFSGVDTFMYEICDATALCDTAMVSVDVSVGGGSADHPGASGRPSDPGEVVPDNPSSAADHANDHACDNPAADHRPGNVPPCGDG